MLLIHQPNTYTSERTYALDVVLGEFMGLEWESRADARTDTEITVPQCSQSRSLTIADGLFATPEEQWLTPQSLPQTPLAHWQLGRVSIAPKLIAGELPIIYGKPLADGSFFEETEDTIRLGVDILGSIFFQLVRYEEIARPARDAHGRFPAAASIAHREGFLTRPLANEYVELLRSSMQRLWPALRCRERTFTESLSHDVDSPLYAASSPRIALKATLADLVRRRDHRLALSRLKTLRPGSRDDHASDPYNTFEFIMDLSESRGLKSAFYFIAGTTDPTKDGTYSIDDPWIGRLIRRIHDRGHEIGLHPSYESFRDPAIVLSEYEALRRAFERLGLTPPARMGGRQHFLRWENPSTWRAWEQAGLAYDSSLGFPDQAGFRCGVCFDYPAFDLVARQPLRLLERPLVIMEQSLFSDRPGKDAHGLDMLRRLRERCRLFDGNFTILWHNSRLASQRERRLYASAVAVA